MHARLDPALEKYVVDGIAGTHDDIGACNSLFRLDDRLDLDTKRRGHIAYKRLAVLRIRTEAADPLDAAHGTSRHELRAGLPARAQNTDRPRVPAREIFDGQPVRGADAHALEHAVGQDSQWLSIRGREQEDEPDVAPVGGGGHLHPPHGVAKLRPGYNIGIDAHCPDAQLGYDAIHGLEAIERLSLPGGGNAV